MSAPGSTALTSPAGDKRGAAVSRALRLEYLTVGWNLVEAGVGLVAALAAGSVALLGFGVDSVVECASGVVLIWRLAGELRTHDDASIERIEGIAHRLVGGSLFLLAACIAIDGAWTLWAREHPRPSPLGIALTSTSLVVMWWLARAKRRAAAVLSSRALEADAFQTTACFWLSLIALVGVALNQFFGWWWADPAGAIAMSLFIVREAREAWRGEDDHGGRKVVDERWSRSL